MTGKKQLGHVVDFLGLEFDTLRMDARLPKDELKKATEGIVRILERKSSTTHKELQLLVGLLSFAAKVIYPGRAFLRRLYDALVKGGTGLSLLKTIFYSGKNFFPNGMESHFYALTANAILYGQMHLAFVVQGDIFYLGIILYKSFAKIYLLATKSVFQTK